MFMHNIITKYLLPYMIINIKIIKQFIVSFNLFCVDFMTCQTFKDVKTNNKFNIVSKAHCFLLYRANNCID